MGAAPPWNRIVTFLLGIQSGRLPETLSRTLADPVDLAALHGQEHVGRCRKAGDDLELHAEQCIERLRIGVGAGADAGVAHDQLRIVEILERLHLGGIGGDADIRLGRGRSEPGDLGRIEARSGGPGDRPQGRVARDDPHHAAVLGGEIVDVIGGHEAAGARHVLRHHRRIARQVLADVAGDHAAPQIVAAAGPETDQHLHVLARKGGGALRPCGRRMSKPARSRDRYERGSRGSYQIRGPGHRNLLWESRRVPRHRDRADAPL